jgi:predicted dehydrogenase
VKKEADQLNIGILGAGPISQVAHLEACQKARNARIYAICDSAADLLENAAGLYRPDEVFHDFDMMLADSNVQAVLIAVADQFHVPLSLQALAAGKHVLVEKPAGVSVEESLELCKVVNASGLVLQIGHNRRFDPGIAFAHQFVKTELGQMQSYKGWYYDSTLRYVMTDNLQPLTKVSDVAKRPLGDPKSDRQRYYMLTHGSHLLDTARFLGGEITAVRARHNESFGAHCWFIELDFASGALGHADLNIPLRGDFEEGFQIAGEFGSVRGRLPLIWYSKSAEVECFSTKDGLYRRPLGADAFTYKLQIESFADVVLHGKPQVGANVHDGLASVQAMVAVAKSVESGERMTLDSVVGGL